MNDRTKLVRVRSNLRFDEVRWGSMIRFDRTQKFDSPNHFLIISAWFSAWYLLLFVSIDRNVGRSQIFALFGIFWHITTTKSDDVSFVFLIHTFLDLIRLLYFWWIFKSRKDGEKDMSFPILRVSFAFMRFLRLSYEPRPNMEPRRHFSQFSAYTTHSSRLI